MMISIYTSLTWSEIDFMQCYKWLYISMYATACMNITFCVCMKSFCRHFTIITVPWCSTTSVTFIPSITALLPGPVLPWTYLWYAASHCMFLLINMIKYCMWNTCLYWSFACTQLRTLNVYNFTEVVTQHMTIYKFIQWILILDKHNQHWWNDHITKSCHLFSDKAVCTG